MEPRLIKNLHAEYIPAEWSGHDTSGVRVVGKTVLVLMDRCSPVSSGDAGRKLLAEAQAEGDSSMQPAIGPGGALIGAQLPPELIERMDMASESGVLIAVSGGAFLLNEDGSPFSGEKPTPGDRVYVEKYAGRLIRSHRDGLTYRLMDYGSIGAVYELDEREKPAVAAE